MRNSPWISTNEWLPDDYVKVLCMGPKGGVFIASCYHPAQHGTWKGDPSYFWWDSNNRIVSRVVYWMPIPEMPEEEVEI